jgi:PPM family protein phosphatase
VLLRYAARTDVGMIRSGNEDNFAVDNNDHRGLFIVADGMGGHAAGEVASEMAVQILLRELSELKDVDADGSGERVAKALRDANRAIHDRTMTEIDKQGMGTTVSALVVSGTQYLIGQVGDSRVYLLRDGALRQLTKDHSYVQEQVDAGFLTPEQARYHPYSNVITRCVGASPDVEPDVYRGTVRPGDTFLVASDGLTGMVDDWRLQQLLMARADEQRVVHSLITEANGRGGLDNITAIVVRVVATDDGGDTAEMPAANQATAETPTSTLAAQEDGAAVR